MTTENQRLGRSAAPYTINHNGRAFEFRALGQVEKSALRAWLIKRMRDTVCLIYEGDDRGRELRQLTADALAGVYDFGGKVSVEAMGTPEGVIQLASILAGATPDDVLELYTARKDELKQTLELAVAESLRRHGYAEDQVKAALARGRLEGDALQAPAGRGRPTEGEADGPFAAMGYATPATTAPT